MKQTLITLFVLSCHFPVFAEFIPYPQVEDFNGFSEVITSISEDFIYKNMKQRNQTYSTKPHIYPSYIYSEDQTAPSDWESDGLTLYKVPSDNPSDLEDSSYKREREKISKVQELLKSFWGDEEFDEQMQMISSQYTLIDIRYYSLPVSDRKNEGCVSVRWISTPSMGFIYNNGTLHICGYHRVESDRFVFEAREYGHNKPGAVNDMSTSLEEAYPLAVIAMDALQVIYQNPENQKLLIEAIQKAHSQ